MSDRRVTEAGAAIYSRWFLHVYDPIVHGFNLPVLWRCPSPLVQGLYDELSSPNHLDVGVGTGRYLAHCRFGRQPTRIALLDMNPNSLAHAGRRIGHYRPEILHGDVLRPLAPPPAPFDSVGMANLLHCLPGPMSRKAAALDNLAAVMQPGAVLFGSTLMGRGVPSTWAARVMMRQLNRRGVFSNRDDDPASLVAALERRFEDVRVDLVGQMALFSARTDVP